MSTDFLNILTHQKKTKMFQIQNFNCLMNVCFFCLNRHDITALVLWCFIKKRAFCNMRFIVLRASFINISIISWGSLLSLSYGSWIYNYLCNQYLSPLKLWVRTPFMVRCTWYNIMWSSLSVTCDRSEVFSGFLTNKTDRHDIIKYCWKWR